MTSIIEKTVALIAPHRCIICGVYNNIACSGCLNGLPGFTQSLCLLCGRPNDDWQPCSSCRPRTELSFMWAHAEYNGTLEALIKEFKFNFIREAARPLANLLHARLPQLDGWQIAFVPTASPRVRWRGYDQAEQLARELARLRERPLVKGVLVRNHNKRQVGASRRERQVQANSLFAASKADRIKGKKILIIDDVCTTGATLLAAADSLSKAGAGQVAAAVVAWQPPRHAGAYQEKSTD